MPRACAKTRIYKVVEVLAGVAVGSLSFRRFRDARACMAQLRDARDLQRDDVEVFRGFLDDPSYSYSIRCAKKRT